MRKALGVFLSSMLAVSVLAGCGASTGAATSQNTEEAVEAEVQAVDANEMLSLWNENAEARQQLISYMEAITKEGGPDYIPVENRIAVFDFDGTLFCETDPNYFDYTLLVYRVLEDPEYKDQASEFEKMVANKIVDQNTNGTKYEELPVEHGQAVASAFKGMTIDEFYAYIQEFKKLPMPSYEGMTRGGGFYEPMLQVIDYLKANDFRVYVISGTDRFICRGLMLNSPLELPNYQIIGSDESVVSAKQGGEDGLNYTFEQGDDLYHEQGCCDQQGDRHPAGAVLWQHDGRRGDGQLHDRQEPLQEPGVHAVLRRPRARERQYR